MKYSSTDIKRILDCGLLNSTLNISDLRLVSFDTRKIIVPNRSLFFALSGNKNDGHKYVQAAYDKGVRNFVVSKEVEQKDDANYFIVDNTLKALQKLATYHRKQFELKVIAITGSYGKTIVKDWLYTLLKKDYAVVKSPKSYNSQIGVAVSLLQIQKHHEIAIIEAGISEVGEMEKLETMIQATIGVFTNIGSAHSSRFKTENHKLEEKLKLFQNSKILISLPKWQGQIEEAKSQLKLYKANEQYDTPFQNQIQQENAQLAGQVLNYLDYSKNEINSRLKNLQALQMRLEIIKGPDQSTIINDAYIADNSSLEIALNVLKEQARNRSKMLIISDYHIEKNEEQEIYSRTAELISAFGLDKIWILGNRLEKYLKGAGVASFEDKDSLIKELHLLDLENKVLLIKGARKYALEDIARLLSAQAHDTKLEINLTAIKHNLGVYASFLKHETEIIGVIKAGAYGSGSADIAQVLVQNGVQYLAVAFTDEALELRKSGITTPIIILNPQSQGEKSWIDHQLEPIIYSLTQLDSVIKLCSDSKSPLAIHININTGMNRLGIELEEIPDLLDALKSSELTIGSVFTHLSSSEQNEHDEYTQKQVDQFKEAYSTIQENYAYPIMRHVLNTAGIVRFPAAQMDAVRLGLGLYGIDLSHSSLDLKKAHSLTSKIIQIKEHEAESNIGYNLDYQTSKRTLVATVPIGYADGLPRLAGNGKYSVLINDQKAPIIGKVCMDLIMVDITDLKDAKVGDKVVIFDESHPIEALADVCYTIPYEILSNISPRVERILIEE